MGDVADNPVEEYDERDQEEVTTEETTPEDKEPKKNEEQGNREKVTDEHNKANDGVSEDEIPTNEFVIDKIFDHNINPSRLQWLAEEGEHFNAFIDTAWKTTMIRANQQALTTKQDIFVFKVENLPIPDTIDQADNG